MELAMDYEAEDFHETTKKKKLNRIVLASVILLCVCIILLVGGVIVAIVVPLVTGANVDFRMGFEHCCPETAEDYNLTSNWVTSCMSQYTSYQQGYNDMNATYFVNALLGLGMADAEYTNALFWTSNMVKNISSIIDSIAHQSPPSSSNIPAGAFGNCIDEYYSSEGPNTILFWLEYSQLMAEKASGYVFWLASGDKTVRYFPAVEMGMMERIFGSKELPNLASPRTTSLTVLNARSPSSQGLSCANDTESRDKLVSINNKLTYFCCDLPLTANDILNTINQVISVLPNPAAATNCIRIWPSSVA